MLQPLLGRPRLLYALSLLACALLLAAADAEPPLVEVAEASAHEGQRVRMEGLASGLRPDTDGGARFTLHDGGDAVPVRAGQAAAGLEGTAWVEASGRLVRLAGRLTLLADTVAVAALPDVASPGWAEVAASPGDWAGRLLRLEGTVEHGELVAPGHRVRLGHGAWPGEGQVEATGTLAYDAACLCHRLDAAEVRPWTS